MTIAPTRHRSAKRSCRSGVLDLTSKTANAYGVDGIPTLFIISESGKVIYGHAGFDGVLRVSIGATGVRCPPGMEERRMTAPAMSFRRGKSTGGG